MNEEQLIDLVCQNPCLWDTSSSNYSNKPMKDRAWVEISHHFPDMSPLDCKTKWKKLKDARTANKKRAVGKSGQANTNYRPYKYAALMSFLDGVDVDLSEHQNTSLNFEEDSPSVDYLTENYDTEEIEIGLESEIQEHSYATQPLSLAPRTPPTRPTRPTRSFFSSQQPPTRPSLTWPSLFFSSQQPPTRLPLLTRPPSMAPQQPPTRPSIQTRPPSMAPQQPPTGPPSPPPPPVSPLPTPQSAAPAPRQASPVPRTSAPRQHTQSQNRNLHRTAMMADRSGNRQNIINRNRNLSEGSSNSISPDGERQSPPVFIAGARNAPARRRATEDNQNNNLQHSILQELQKRPDDEHEHFAMSIVPMMRNLPAAKASELRIKIYQLLHEATFENLIN